jgi:hypothetical protein
MDVCRREVPPLFEVPGGGPHVSACFVPRDPDERRAARATIAAREAALARTPVVPSEASLG